MRLLFLHLSCWLSPQKPRKPVSFIVNLGTLPLVQNMTFQAANFFVQVFFFIVYVLNSEFHYTRGKSEARQQKSVNRSNKTPCP